MECPEAGPDTVESGIRQWRDLSGVDGINEMLRDGENFFCDCVMSGAGGSLSVYSKLKIGNVPAGHRCGCWGIGNAGVQDGCDKDGGQWRRINAQDYSIVGLGASR